VRPVTKTLLLLLVAVVALASCGKDKGTSTSKKDQEVEAHLKAARANFLDHDRAIAELDKAIELDETCVEAYEQRAEIYEAGFGDSGRSKDAAKAIADYDTLMKLEPKSTKAAERLRKRAWLKAELGQYDEAIADLNASRKRDQYNWRTYEQLAKAYIGNKDLESAIKAYSLAIKCDRNNASLYKSRAHVYFDLGDKQKAIPDLKKVTDLQPDLEAYAELAWIYSDLGDPHTALDYYNKARELDPDFERKLTRW